MYKGFSERYLFIIFSAIMMAGFYFNIYKTASNDFFYYHQRDSEALIIGRLIPKIDDALFPGGTMMNITPGTHQDRHHVDATYDLYLNDKSENRSVFSLYNGQFGLQSHVIYALHKLLKILNFENKSIYAIIQFASSLLLAMILSLILILFKRHFELLSSAIVCAIIVTSPWLTVFARNLYWVPFTWFLPILASWWFYVEKKEFSEINKRAIFIISLFLFVKFLCGLEYITAIAGSVIIISIYGMIKNCNSIRVIITNTILLIAGSSAALLTSIIAHVLQDAYYSGNIMGSISVFLNRVAYRAYGSPENYTGIMADSLNSTILPILNTYWSNSDIFNLAQVVQLNARSIIAPIIIIFLILIIISLLLKIEKRISINNYIALGVLFFGSLAASISWFIVGKAHSYIHTHMNYVLWHITFMIFAVPVIVFLFKALLPRGFTYVAPSTLITAIVLFNQCFPAGLDTTKVIAKFEVSNGSISLLDNGIYFDLNCQKIEDFGEHFFLHMYVPEKHMPETYKNNEFINMDFKWSENRTSNILGEYFNQKCTAFVKTNSSISLNELPISHISFGQFRLKGDLSRIWEENIDIVYSYSSFDGYILVEDYTDHQWTNGFNNIQNAFLTRNSFENRQALGLSKGVVIGNNNLEIARLFIRDQWINVYMSEHTIIQKNQRKIKTY